MSIKLELQNQAEFSLYSHMSVQTEQTKVGSGFRQFVQSQSPKEVLTYRGSACAFSLLSLHGPKNKLSKHQFVSLHTPYRVCKLSKLKIRKEVHHEI
jgi:hypothetical protein